MNGLGHCAACHAPRNGLGAITDSAGLTGGVILGLDWYAPATADNSHPHGMPPFAHLLSDNDIAMLVLYIRNSWGNEAGGVTTLGIKRARAASTTN